MNVWMSKLANRIRQATQRRHISRRKSQIQIVFTSSLSSGAWRMRGEQLASVYANWRAVLSPSKRDLSSADLIVGVKRLAPDLLHQIRDAGVPFAYDLVDPWKQPDDDRVTSDVIGAQKVFRRICENVKPDVYLYVTEQMKADLEPVLGFGFVHRHHFDPSAEVQPFRSSLTQVGYDGDPRFLGEWNSLMLELAGEVGFTWIPKAHSLRNLDAVFMGRGGEYNAYLASSYKSNVKLANAMAAGVPALVQAAQAAYDETSPRGAKHFFSDRESLKALLFAFKSEERRKELRELYLRDAHQFSVRTIAETLEKNLGSWLENR